MKNNIIIQITLAILAVIGVVWYLFVYQPAQATIKHDQAMRAGLGKCLETVNGKYSTSWNTSCKTLGINHKNDHCALPRTQVDHIEEWIKDEIARCYKLYPLN